MEIWQKLLASEAPINRLWPLILEARAETSLSWHQLTETERTHSQNASAIRELSSPLQIVEFGASQYPAFVLGDSAVLQWPLVGIVGTRKISSYGKQMAEYFATKIALSGCTVVSGGAIGIDSAAHSAALEATGKTACILPSGVDVATPPRHAALFKNITENGCLVSRFACGSPASNHRLIQRNHFLAQIVKGLIVIEAPEESGTLITAQAAIEAQVPVFVVPGPASQSSFKGSHNLIRNGATLVDCPEQVLGALEINAAPDATSVPTSLAPEEAVVFDALEGLPQSPEKLSHLTGISPSEVLTALTMLELQGVVVRTHDGYARKS